MAQAGIDDDATVVAYDDAGGVIAARLVWMLRVTGHNAALLDGGLSRYPDRLEAGEVRRPSTDFRARPVARRPSRRTSTTPATGR